MRKILLMLIVLTATLLLAACGAGAADEETEIATPTAVSEPAKALSLEERLNRACSGMILGLDVNITPVNYASNEYAQKVFDIDITCFEDFFIRVNFLSEKAEAFILAKPNAGREADAKAAINASSEQIKLMFSTLDNSSHLTDSSYEMVEMPDGLYVLAVSGERQQVIEKLDPAYEPEPLPEEQGGEDAQNKG